MRSQAGFACGEFRVLALIIVPALGCLAVLRGEGVSWWISVPASLAAPFVTIGVIVAVGWTSEQVAKLRK